MEFMSDWNPRMIIFTICNLLHKQCFNNLSCSIYVGGFIHRRNGPTDVWFHSQLFGKPMTYSHSFLACTMTDELLAQGCYGQEGCHDKIELGNSVWCNVTDTILWQGHHDRVMQLN